MLADMKAPRKYGILRIIALVLKVLAWAVLVLGIVGMFGLFGIGGSFGPDAAILRSLTSAGAPAVLLIAIVWFVQLFAFGSILSLLIEIEQNTRALASDAGGGTD
jgi:hypothetical protein